MVGPFNISAPGHHPHGPVSPLQGPNALQGNALATLIWVGYDLLLVLDREIVCVWKSPWSATKILYLLLRCNGLLALSFYFMETLGTTPFVVMLSLPPPGSGIPPDGCLRAIKSVEAIISKLATELASSSVAGRAYIAATELFSVLAGEALILIRINAMYGWARQWIVFTVLLFVGESIVGIVTTAITFLGGSERLAGSTKVLNCSGDANNVPDLNVGMWCISVAVTCIYLSMLLRMAHILASENSMSIRDACCYFIVVFVALLMNLVLITAKLGYAQIGTPWLIAAYTVTSTRIFLNLKDLARRATAYNSATWSEFERASELNFRSL